MLISIFSATDSDSDLIMRSLPAHDCQRVAPTSAWRRPNGELEPHLLIVDIAAVGPLLPELLLQARTLLPLPVLLLAADDAAQLSVLATLPSAALVDIEFKPLRRQAVAARVKLLLERAYPGHDNQQWQQFGDFHFERSTCMVHQGNSATLMTRKEFALALLFFKHLNRPLSRAYLQEVVWGHEEESDVPMRTIDTHISRVRNKLNLKPEHGYRLSTVYGYGYQLERLEPESLPAATATP
jgi:DNA-binding response OmpR family regulator